MLFYFISHQSKTAHPFIMNFSMILSFFVYAGKSHAVLEYIFMCHISQSQNSLTHIPGKCDK